MKYILTLSLFFSLTIFSQNNQQLDEVIVSDSKINVPFSKNFRSIEIISSSDIIKSGASNIIDLLQQPVGLDIRRRGAGGVLDDTLNPHLADTPGGRGILSQILP